MTSIIMAACVPLTFLLATVYEQSFTRVFFVVAGVTALFMIGLPLLFVIVGYAIRAILATPVRVNAERLVYGAKTLPIDGFTRISLDKSSATRPRLVMHGAAGFQFWIGVAPQVDLGILERICARSAP